MRIFYFSPQNIHDNIRGIHGIAIINNWHLCIFAITLIANL